MLLENEEDFGTRRNIRGMLNEVPCAKCNKLFIPAPCHSYKLRINNHIKLFCSYTCFRAEQTRLGR